MLYYIIVSISCCSILYHIVLYDHNITQFTIIHYNIIYSLRPVHLLRVSLLRVLESNFPGDPR